jgi:transcriptional regulator with XRE-family HTH domain
VGYEGVGDVKDGAWLRSELDAIQMRQVDLARALDVTPRAVSLWCQGGRKVPGSVVAYLRLFAALDDGAKYREKLLTGACSNVVKMQF